MKKVFKFTAIWNLIQGLIPIIICMASYTEVFQKSGYTFEQSFLEGLVFIIAVVLSVLKIPVLISGIVFVNYLLLSNEEFAEKKRNIIIWSIINIIFTNLVGGITGLIAADKIKSIQNKKEKLIITHEEQKELKRKNKFNILLNMGIFLIVFSGLIISTTTWNIISDNLKILLLFVTSIVFGILSYLFKTKIENKKVEMVYYILSCIFLELAVIGIAIYGNFGKYLSFSGQGKHIVLAFILALGGIIAYSLRKIYNKENYIYLQYILNNFAIIVLFSSMLDSNIKIIAAVIQFIILGIVYINMLFKLRNKYQYQILLPIISIINLMYVASYISEALKVSSVILWSTIVLIGNLIIMKTAVVDKNKLTLKIITTILYNIVIVANLLILRIENTAIMIIFSIIYLIDNILILLPNENRKYFVVEKYLQPIKILAVIISIFSLLDYYCFKLGFMGILLAINITVLISYLIYNKTKIRNIFLGISLILSYTYLVISIVNISVMLYMINIIILSIILMITYKKKDIYRGYKYFTNIGIGIALFLLCDSNIITNAVILKYINNVSLAVETLIQQFASLIIHLIGICIYLIMVIETRKNKRLLAINLLFGAFLGISFTNELYFINKSKDIIINIIWTLSIFNITRLLLQIKKIKVVNIIETIALILVQLPIIFGNNILAVICIFAIDIIFIFLGIKSKNVYSLFSAGTILIVLTVILRFKEFFLGIPFPIYMFFLGVAILMYITFREIKKKDIENISSGNIEKKEKVVKNNKK